MNAHRKLNGGLQGNGGFMSVIWTNSMELSELTDKAVDYILSGLESETRLTEWEKNFVESISDQWTRSRRLSDKQKEVLGKIWDKY